MIIHVYVDVCFRRLVYTTDPQYPTIIASGTMPALTVHLSEQKVCAFVFKNIVSNFFLAHDKGDPIVSEA